MRSRCLNPNCATPFRYLDEGRIFRIEQVHTWPGATEPQRSVESYWLCGTCSRRLKVIVENGEILTSPMNAAFSHGWTARELTSVL